MFVRLMVRLVLNVLGVILENGMFFVVFVLVMMIEIGFCVCWVVLKVDRIVVGLDIL